MNEIWKDVKGYEGIYQISSLGRVKVLEHIIKTKNGYNQTRRECIKSLATDKDGYKQTILWKDKKPKRYYIHRLVAENFLDNPNNLPIINHKNEIKNDNRVDNLEYCDLKYNLNYGNAQKKRIEKQCGLWRKYSEDGTLLEEFKNLQEYCRKNPQFKPTSINSAAKRYKNLYRGFKWERVN